MPKKRERKRERLRMKKRLYQADMDENNGSLSRTIKTEKYTSMV